MPAPMTRVGAALLAITLMGTGSMDAHAAPSAQTAPPAPASVPQPAGPTPGPRARATPARVAILPLGALTEGAGSRSTIEILVHSSARGFVPTVTSAAEARAALLTARRPELEACDEEPACLVELGRLLGVTTLVGGEVGAIGDGLVLYLEAFDVEAGAQLGSTTATLQGDPAARARVVRAAVTRLLAPERHAGTLTVRSNLKGAQVYVDGRLLGTTPLDAPLSAGTHALRVTHPEARDLIRFVEVPFEEITAVDAQLVALPVVTDVIGGAGGRAKGGERSRGGWWGPVLVGVGAAVLAGVIVVALDGGGLDVDDSIGIDRP